MIIIKNYSDFEVPIKVYDSDGLPINPLDASVLDISVFTTSKNSSLEFDKSDIDPERITISIDGQDASLLDNGVLFYQYHLEMEDPKYPDGNYKAERLVQTDIYIMNVQEGHKSTCATMVSELINDAGYITLLEARPIIEEEVIKDISTLVLDEYATKEYVDQAVDNEKDRAEIVESGILNRIGNIEEELDAKQDVLVSGTNIKTINNISILGSGNIDISSGSIDPQDLSIYATKEWVEGQGYLTEHQSLEGYATEEYVDGSIDAVRDEIPEVPTNVSAFNNDAGYLTSHQDISGKQDVLVSGTNIKTINNISILGSGNIDISSGSIDPQDLSIYATKQYVDSSFLPLTGGIIDGSLKIKYKPIIIGNDANKLDGAANIVQLTSVKDISLIPGIGGSLYKGYNEYGNQILSFKELGNNYYNKKTIDASIAEVKALIPDVSTFATKQYVDGSINQVRAEIPTVPTNVSAFTNDAGYLTQHQDISGKQDVLVSGTNIKTINNVSILGSGNIDISSGSIDPQDLSIYATKEYVDSSFLPLAGGTVEGTIYFSHGQYSWIGPKLATSLCVSSDNDVELRARDGIVKYGKGYLNTTYEIATLNDISTNIKSNQVANMWAGTQAEYDALSVKDVSTFYIIKAN